MNIENIEAFVYVNHYGSFNKAAEVLFLSQPSVTARIQTLERELDCKLFDRQGKQIMLTEKGKQFLPYAQQILQTIQKGRLHLQDRVVRPQELRIGSTVSVSNYLIPDILPQLRRHFPELAFKLTTAPSDELVKKLLDREIDLAFVRKLSHPSLQSYPFYEDPIRLYVYEGHPFAETRRVTIGEIRHQTLVFFECGSLDWLRLHRVFEHLEHKPHIAFHADNSETAKKLVLQKAGICFLPGLCAKEEEERGSLIPVEIEETKGISLYTNLIALTGENEEFIHAILAKESMYSI
ncbi:LysR family transcriptional regulator [Paenibacillus methanolicus]|uniref:DNA-binding transcriptional LysR family regulator n=1 Tax=Paenibacillus methanolicus TaxID=582686 RepID=A0A5S5C8F0_9BACL|nr:LysR family transcriptional regulator [Paenibacillus methanolicus]TYP74762.1 DNA-binding transcriptional LysR family regulator [Paenibacillus methanolicus]